MNNKFCWLWLALLLVLPGCFKDSWEPCPVWQLKLVRPDGAVYAMYKVPAVFKPEVDVDWGGVMKLRYYRDLKFHGRCQFSTEEVPAAPNGWFFDVDSKPVGEATW